jgi:hypothetical protein
MNSAHALFPTYRIYFPQKLVLDADGARFLNAHYWAGRMELDGACAMSSVAGQPDAPPELREQLLQMAH